ncbi:MAG: CorA family divalent cation transporter [Polyangia bacterium]
MWLHFNLADNRVRSWIRRQRDWPEEARETLLNPSAHVFAQTLPHGLVAVLSDLHHDLRADPEGFGLLSIYIDRRWAISGRRHALRSADQLRRSLLRGLEVETPMAWFQELVLALADTAAKVVNGLNDEVDDAEDKILVGRVHAQATVLGRIRRILARLRRQVVANRAALATVSANFPAWCDPEYRESSRQAVGRLEAVAQDLELVQERTRLLQEEIASRLGEATSRNLFLLSVLTATFLPVTLISGIFGMNVGGLPWLKSPSGFWWACGLMVAAAVTTLLLLRKWRN